MRQAILAIVLLAIGFTAGSMRRSPADAEADPCLLQAADLNGDTQLDISDAIFLLFHLYAQGQPPNPAVVAPVSCLEDLQAQLTEAERAADWMNTERLSCWRAYSELYAEVDGCANQMQDLQIQIAARDARIEGLSSNVEFLAAELGLRDEQVATLVEALRNQQIQLELLRTCFYGYRDTYGPLDGCTYPE